MSENFNKDKEEIKREIERAIEKGMGSKSQPDAEFEEEFTPQRGTPTWKKILTSDLFGRISNQEIAFFARQFSLLLKLGISVMKSLAILKNRTANIKLQKIIASIEEEVKKGNSLTSAFEKYPKVFNDFFINTIRAGEASGEIDRSMEILANYLETEQDFVQKIQSALLYPILVFCAAIVAFFILMAFVIPTFAQVYRISDVQLPLPTRITLAVSYFIGEHFLLLCALIVILIVLFVLFSRTPNGKAFNLMILLRIPVVGTILHHSILYRFSRLFSTMIDAGVGILPSILVARNISASKDFIRAVDRVYSAVEQGSRLDLSLYREKFFPGIMVDMISIGEETANLGEVLHRIADYYQNDLNRRISNVSVVLEPVMTLIAGLLVAFIALSMFLPYFNLSRVLV